MLTARRLSVALAACVLTGLTACGGGGDRAPRTNPPAPPYVSRSTAPGDVPRVTAADYREPIATYKRYVRRELGHMQRNVAELRGAVARGSLDGARAAWLRADARYESIGAAYGAFGDLDAAINGRPDGLADGVHSPEFAGLHRIEHALWQQRSTRAAAAASARLARSVATLRDRIGAMVIDPLEYALRAHEILEDGIHLQLSGQASPWSGSALTALRAEVRGTTVVLDTLQPLITRRDTSGALPQARKAIGRLLTTLSDLRRADGTLPRWDRLDQRRRELVDGLAAGAAEQLAYVPELIDPRPPRPAQRAFGDVR